MWQINDDYQWEKLSKRFDWVREMQGVPQNPIFHAEGDVYTHTRMVLEALEHLPAFRALDEQDQHILRAAALLHDVEKRSTTAVDSDGNITSYGHAKKGELTARSILYLDVPTPFEIREQVVKLVKHHGLPLRVFSQDDPRKAVIVASLEVNTQHLSILAEADVRGRIASDKDELLYRLALFQELCLEHDCWGNARSFVNPFSRFFYLKREGVAPEYEAYNDTKFEVVLMSGLPGAGKSMWINYHLSNWPQISPEELRREMKIKPRDKSGWGRVQQRAKEKAKELMRSRKSFVWNGTNLSFLVRESLIELFLSYGAYVKIVFLEIPFLQLQEQNRNMEDPPSAEAMVKMLAKYEVPSLLEAHEVQWIIRAAPPAAENESLDAAPSEPL